METTPQPQNATGADTAGAPPRRRRLGVMLVGAVVLVGIGTVGQQGLYGQRKTEHVEAPPAANPPTPSVQTVTPKRSAVSNEVVFPGNVQAVQEGAVYARTNGYVRRRLVDIGDRVTAGQLLAEIESPEVDQELLQGRANLLRARAALGQVRATAQQVQANLQQVQANLQQSRANMELARTTLQRWKQLAQDQVVPQQQVDEKHAAFEASQASVNASQASINAVQANVQAAQANVSAQEAEVSAQEANVRRLETVQSFQKVTAPFAGVITVRNVEVGGLITAGSGTTSRELFRVAQTETLRVYVNVPQAYATSIQPGQTAQVLVRELPQKTFAGKVARTTGSMDAASRTLPMEIHVDNQEHALLPGMYAQVKFSVSRATIPILVPANALIIRADGPQVAMVQSDQTVHYQKVKVERDYGTEVEVTSGLRGDEALIMNPTNDLVEGATVRAVVVPPQEKK